jgi:TRAF3-interacting protein 1
MGEEAPVPPWILQTQATLGTIVKKPRLTDNLLKKPPFRFLHDVVSEVTRQTGFPDQLFPEEEMIGKAIKDKETKLSYLNKLVCCIGNALGSPVNVNPKKIVAGHEPEKTNGMLQALYEVATGDPAAAQQAVQRTLAGETPAGVAPLGPPPQFGSAGGRPQSSSKAKRSDPPAPAPAPPPAQTSEPVFPEAPPQAAEPEKPRRRQRKPPQQQDEAPAPPAQQPPPPGPHGPPGGGAPDDRQEFVPPNRNSLPERPQTARRAPPKVKSNEVPVDRPPSGNPGGGGRGASDVVRAPHLPTCLAAPVRMPATPFV